MIKSLKSLTNHVIMMFNLAFLDKIYKILLFSYSYQRIYNEIAVQIKMVKVKLIDLFNIRFEQMENKINQEISTLEEEGFSVREVKVLGDSLKNAGIFIVYE